MQKTNKILGYFLLFGGILIILWSVYASYNIFITKTAAPEIFKIEEKSALTPQKGIKTQTPEDLISQALGEQFGNLLPTGSIPALLNLISWSIFASILIFAGSKISSLGISLVKS